MGPQCVVRREFASLSERSDPFQLQLLNWFFAAEKVLLTRFRRANADDVADTRMMGMVMQ